MMTTTDTRARRAGFTRMLLGKSLAITSLVWLVLITGACLLAPVISPYSPLEQDLQAALKLPSAAHLLGTDALGRDVLSRLLYGGQPALWGAAQAVIVVFVLGIVVGVLVGFNGGWLDRITGPIFDVLLALPAIVVSLAVLAVFDQSMSAAMISLGIMGSASVARVVRSATLAVRSQLYIDAAVVSGQSRPRILVDHVFRRVAGPIVVQLSLFAAFALYVQTGLTYLGLTVTPPDPTWGSMVAEAAQVIQSDGWLLVPSGGVIAVTVLALGLLGDGVRDALVDVWSQGSVSGRARGARAETATRTPGAPDAEALLSVRALSVTFDTDAGETEVVHGIDLDVHRGDVVGLVGESGSGKTVTGHAVLGLLPPNATARGSIVFDGTHLVGAGRPTFAQLRGRRVALISQEPMAALDPSKTVGSLLVEVIRIHRRSSRAQARARAIELVDAVSIPDPAGVLRRYPHQLSGGMAQRVAIALALAGDPELIIADEPTTALDVTVQAEVLDVMRELRRERGLTVVFITHNLGVVADFCTRAIVMEKGRIVEQADVSVLFAAPKHPYTRQLIAATPNLLSPRSKEAVS